MKRIAMFLCVIVSLLCMNKLVFADSKVPTVTVDNVITETGGKVEVPINLSNNTGICGATFHVSFL